jgi:hypothetical protein
VPPHAGLELRRVAAARRAGARRGEEEEPVVRRPQVDEREPGELLARVPVLRDGRVVDGEEGVAPEVDQVRGERARLEQQAVPLLARVQGGGPRVDGRAISSNAWARPSSSTGAPSRAAPAPRRRTARPAASSPASAASACTGRAMRRATASASTRASTSASATDRRSRATSPSR